MRFARVLLIVVFLPAPLLAQGMGMGGMGGGMGGAGGNGRYDAGRDRVGRNTMPKFATAKELEKFNAADALLRERGRLKLSDVQVEQLSALRARLFETNADLLVRYDAIRRDFKVPAALEANAPASAQSPTREEMSLLGEKMRAMAMIADELMARRPEQVAACLQLVDDSQRNRATDLLKDQTSELRKQVPELPKARGR